MQLPVIVEVDNIGAIFMTGNSTCSSCTRHIDTQHCYVKDLQNECLIKVEFVRSEDNVSDIATKNVTGEVHEIHMKRLYQTRWMCESNVLEEEGC